jgi:hypothetical protein
MPRDTISRVNLTFSLRFLDEVALSCNAAVDHQRLAPVAYTLPNQSPLLLSGKLESALNFCDLNKRSLHLLPADFRR